MKIRVHRDLERLPKVSGGDTDSPNISGRLNRLLMQAEDEAKRLKDSFVSVEHILLAMTDDGGATGRLIKEFGVTRERLMSAHAASARQSARHIAKPRRDVPIARKIWP